MISALVLSASDKKRALLSELLKQNDFVDIVTASRCASARRLLLCRDFDLCVIDAPLPDDFGSALAVWVAEESAAQVILLVPVQMLDEICAKTEQAGVLTLSKPVSRDSFWRVLKVAGAAHNKIARLKKENTRLITTIEDIRIIDRAKCLLIEQQGVTEAEAHRRIEKQAMDSRLTKKAVAQEIIDRYSKK